MCIIVYKPKNKKMPSKSILETCFYNNPDGAGFMFLDKDYVRIEKGFDTFDSFYKALQKTSKHFNTSPYVLHFRISTQAGTRPDCTHPFPLSDNMDNLRKLRYFTDIGIAHNGIITLTSEYGLKKTITYSDTMTFITDYLSLIIRNTKYYLDDKTLKLIERLADSKLAILDKFGHCELIGNFTEDNGIFYSNASYMTKTVKSYSRDFNIGTYLEDYNKPDYNGETVYYNDKALAEIEAEYAHYYDDETDLYYFDVEDCPDTVYGIYNYCDKCWNCDICFGRYSDDTETEQKAGAI